MGPVHPDQIKIDSRLAAIRAGYSDDEGHRVIAGRIGGPRAIVARFAHDIDNPTHIDLRRFAEWRMSKCCPRDYDQIGDRLADLDQATLELTGEAGEVAEVILAINDEAELFGDKIRAKLIDEVGDVIFCASWLADAWGANPLRMHAKQGEAMNALRAAKADRNLNTAVRVALFLNANTGLLANSAKKVLCQGREQDIDTQFRRLVHVFDYSAILLSIVGASVYEATARNVEKLDARFPDGHPLVGGGIRTGKGA